MWGGLLSTKWVDYVEEPMKCGVGRDWGGRVRVRLDYLSNQIQILKNGGWVGVVGWGG